MTLHVCKKCCRSRQNNNFAKFKVFWRACIQQIQRQIFSFFQSAFIQLKPTRKLRVGKSRSQFTKKKVIIIMQKSIHILKRRFLLSRLARLAGTELHLAGRGVWFVTCKRLPVDFPGWAHFSTRA